jgi:alpha-beta hydrolase superfamily lysophospholipase
MFSLSAYAGDAWQGDKAAFDVEEVRRHMAPLRFDTTIAPHPCVESYFRFYRLDYTDVTHRFGTFESDTFLCAAHVFIPPDPLAVVFIVHGYYDHVGIQANVIRYLLDWNYAVAAFDLPGHGLSSGTRASVPDFSDYARALDECIRLCRPHLPARCYLVGHSIGGAVILEYLYMTGDSEIEKIVLVAPGVRSVMHGLSKVGYALVSPFSETGPRWFRNSSADTSFLSWYRTDPLQYGLFPLRFAGAMYEWQKRFRNYDTLGVRATMIQGSNDEVVDWKYGMKALKEKIPDLKIIPIPGARHQIMNEAQPLRREFFTAFGREFSDRDSGR